jgi:hypothetical protein
MTTNVVSCSACRRDLTACPQIVGARSFVELSPTKVGRVKVIPRSSSGRPVTARNGHSVTAWLLSGNVYAYSDSRSLQYLVQTE